MKEYQITLSENQLNILNRITSDYARLVVGQTDKLEGVFLKALKRHQSENLTKEEKGQEQDYVISLLETLHRICWKQNTNEFYGVGYSELSDTLIDMNEVIRHQLWQDYEGEKSRYTVDSDKPFHWNKKEPLIKIEKI